MTEAYPISRPHQLPKQHPDTQWLIDSLWAHQAVGIVGGEPKCCKSILALEIAVSVASGTHCLNHFQVCNKGPVLLFAAEDRSSIVRQRIEGLAAQKHLDFDKLNIFVIDTPSIRLDLTQDQQRLNQTVEKIRPQLLILDPFVRLHRVDENHAADVAPLLAFLRELQRRFDTAVLLVHHAKKAASSARAGQALRGSSELHAWGDSNLYLRRNYNTITLSIEHRAFPTIEALCMEIQENDGNPLLDIIDQSPPPTANQNSSASMRILQALQNADHPLALRDLRSVCRIRTQTLCDTINLLLQLGKVNKSDDGRFFAV